MSHATERHAARSGGLRSALAVAGLLVLVASAVIGSGLFGLRARLFGSVLPEPQPAERSRVASEPGVKTGGEETVLRSQPWWQKVEVFRGQGDGTTPSFIISDTVIQWRVKWTCQSGRLVIRLPGQSEPAVNESCPAAGDAYATEPGRGNLQVSADGPWTATVEQQIDVPLKEPPLAAMNAPGSRIVTKTRFYGIERTGTGQLVLYRLANGRYALRLNDFYVTPNVDLELRFSVLARPESTREYLRARSVAVAPLPITAGALNFMVPKAVDPDDYRSLVVWCPPLSIAYAAAPLRRGE